MQWEEQAARDLNLDWRSVLWVAESRTPSGQISQVLRKFKSLDWLLERASFYLFVTRESRLYDLVLLRYSTNDPLLFLTGRCLRKKLVLVHHTLGLQEIRTHPGIKSAAKLALESLLQWPNHYVCAAIVSVTPEIGMRLPSVVTKRRIPRLVYPNGIAEEVMLAEDRRSQELELLFVASYFAPWHGLDLLWASAQETDRQFLIHVVGQVSSRDRQLVLSDSRFREYGILPSEEISNLAARSHLGLSAFALGRIGIEQACPLKVREYLAMGLPVAGDHREVFPKSFNFYVQLSQSIEQYLDAAESFRTVSREAVRAAAWPHIQKRALVKNLYQELSELNSDNSRI